MGLADQRVPDIGDRREVILGVMLGLKCFSGLAFFERDVLRCCLEQGTEVLIKSADDLFRFTSWWSQRVEHLLPLIVELGLAGCCCVD